jgi:hypothetical protein
LSVLDVSSIRPTVPRLRRAEQIAGLRQRDMCVALESKPA